MLDRRVGNDRAPVDDPISIGRRSAEDSTNQHSQQNSSTPREKALNH
jgi:hypothetical protein